MNRLHPHDLRAIMAAIIHGPIQEGTSVVVEATDYILGQLHATARAIPSPGLEPPRPAGCPSCADAEAQVDRLNAALDLANATIKAQDAEIRHYLSTGLGHNFIRDGSGLCAAPCHACEMDRLKKALDGARDSAGKFQARAELLSAALDEEARARKAAADGLADAKEDWDRLMATFNLLLPILEEGAATSMVPRSDAIRALAHVKDLLIGQHPGPDPAIPADDLVEALDEEPHRGWDEGHDTPEERDGER